MRSNTPSTILSQVNGITARVGVIESSDGSAKTNVANDGTGFDLKPGERYVVQCADTDLALTPSPLLTTPTDIGTASADPALDLVIPKGQPCMVCLRPAQGDIVQVLSVAAADGSTPFNAKVLLLF